MTRPARMVSLAVAVISTLSCRAQAEVALGSLFSDHMVLQRDVADPIWGTAKPDSEVKITIDGKEVAHGKADGKGIFKVNLPKMAAPGAHVVVVSAGDESATLNDVLFGDVWICSGQSNMEFRLEASNDGDKEVASATNPNIRLYQVPRLGSAEPVSTIKSGWTPCTSQTAKGFTAVGYFFGRHLNQALNVPIGLIHSSWGGTPAEAWTPLSKLEALTDLPLVQKQLARRKIGMTPGAMATYIDDLKKWLTLTGRDDQVIKPDAIGWEKVTLDDATAWKPMAIPADFAKQGVANGCVWFRKEIDLPANAAGKPLTLMLGKIDEYDISYFNGQKVGSTGSLPPDDWTQARQYVVPGELVNAGKNVIAVRVFDTGVAAGLLGPAASMMATTEGLPPIPLEGEWMYRQESVFKPAVIPEPARPAAPMQLDHPNAPSSLYNGMIAPLADFGIKGAIWYQGEANAERYPEYQKLLSTMIGAWRDQFGQGDFPFYIVGLANFMAPTEDPNQLSNWANLREAQRLVGREVKNAGSTVTIDIGEEGDIHPKDKQDVGKRIALEALESAYGKTLVSRGPTFRDAKFENGKVIVSFDHVGGGLKSIKEPLESFAIAGDDGKFVWADADIEGDTVVLTAKGVDVPTKVHYAFADNPKATLFNAEGLPAEPFEAKK